MNRGAPQRGPKPLKKPGGVANMQSSHDESQNFLAVHRDRNEIRMCSRSSNAISQLEIINGDNLNVLQKRSQVYFVSGCRPLG